MVVDRDRNLVARVNVVGVGVLLFQFFENSDPFFLRLGSLGLLQKGAALLLQLRYVAVIPGKPIVLTAGKEQGRGRDRGKLEKKSV